MWRERFSAEGEPCVAPWGAKPKRVLTLAFLVYGVAGCARYVPDPEPSDTGPEDAPSRVDLTLEQDQQPADQRSDLFIPPDLVSPVPGTWQVVSGGAFKMGSPSNEPCRHSNETYHNVLLTHAFQISQTPVTQGQFEQLMGYVPAFFGSCGSDCPVEMVSWAQAASYCNALSAQAGLNGCYYCNGNESSTVCGESPGYEQEAIYTCPGYRLPTEAEWEFAYRAGTASAYYSGNAVGCVGADANATAIGWYTNNSEDHTHPVGEKQANAAGLQDMAGNVREWCNDWYSEDLGSENAVDPWGPSTGEERVLRGGGWGDEPATLRGASRQSGPPGNRSNLIGFRCVRSVL